MSEFVFKGILQENGWIENVVINTDEHGIIESIHQDNSRNDHKDYETQ